jgi:hypothetical protein
MQTGSIREIAIGLIGGLIFSSCGPTAVPQSPKNGSTGNDGDKMLAVPEFSVSISLPEAARKRLQTLHESVLVIAYFDGDALPGQGKLQRANERCGFGFRPKNRRREERGYVQYFKDFPSQLEPSIQ